MQLVFIHGWAFSPDIWLPIQQNLPGQSFTNVDLGYFQHPATLVNTLPDNALYIGHSLGVLWALEHVYKKMSGLVSISGFDCFYQHVPAKNIALMKYGIKKNTNIQLASFARQCGLGIQPAHAVTQKETLLDGLNTLSKSDCSKQRKELAIPILPLASTDDAIVSASMTEKIWKDYNIQWNENGGHILPLKEPEWCALHISNFLKQL